MALVRPPLGLDGETVSSRGVADLDRFAADLAAFLVALQRIDAADGPPAGPHNFFRGGPLGVHDAQTRESLAALRGEIDVAAATGVWEAALAARWDDPDVRAHGDVAAANLLARVGRLSAVIDFGCCGVGDAACDLVIAWTFLDAGGRRAFRAALGADARTWARARGWALWKALLILAGGASPGAAEAPARGVAGELLAERAGDEDRG